ncbi:hypothetical protein DP939_15800 [Spongiactinospora rosea]|uniref:Uncharacterized protein n=2 Tax=Spongiactinospora rosea TaxID=2248750 RepID=A0A366M0S0_9ACTN|nr:hypothetical protein DP939_15800 [Spongiactinospora rosea]
MGVEVDVVSGFYSQSSGTMAGLAFTALVLLLGARDSGGDKRYSAPHALMALFVTLFCLLATMVTYSVLAGNKDVDGRTAASEMVAGLGLSLAVQMLFFSLLLLLEMRPEHAAVARVARWVTVVVIPMVGLLFLMFGAQGTEYLRTTRIPGVTVGACEGSVAVPLTSVALFFAMGIVLIGARAKGIHLRWARERRSWPSIVALGWSVLSFVLFTAITLQPTGYLMPRLMVLGFMSFAAIVLATMGVLIQAGGPVSRPLVANDDPPPLPGPDKAPDKGPGKPVADTQEKHPVLKDHHLVARKTRHTKGHQERGTTAGGES